MEVLEALFGVVFFGLIFVSFVAWHSQPRNMSYGDYWFEVLGKFISYAIAFAILFGIGMWLGK